MSGFVKSAPVSFGLVQSVSVPSALEKVAGLADQTSLPPANIHDVVLQASPCRALPLCSATLSWPVSFGVPLRPPLLLLPRNPARSVAAGACCRRSQLFAIRQTVLTLQATCEPSFRCRQRNNRSFYAARRARATASVR